VVQPTGSSRGGEGRHSGRPLSAGNTSSIKWFSGIGEIRIDWGPGYRVYLAKDGEALILLFFGGAKKRQQADIETARALHAEYKKRKKGATRKAR
jgi:putative addiction module killer protein